MQQKIFNKTEYKDRRKTLRHNATQPEQVLWQKLRAKQLGVKFRRQHGIGHYIVDFYSPEAKLVIELDGDSHFVENAPEYDAIRDAFMAALSLRVIRILNQDVMQNLAGVCEYIQEQIASSLLIKPHPSPLLNKEKE